MVLLGIASIPRGGTLTVRADAQAFLVCASGRGARINDKIAEVLAGTAGLGDIDARLVQSYYTMRLAAAAGLTLAIVMDGSEVVVSARAS
jgi:histidine phosphotransferase ChpT